VSLGPFSTRYPVMSLPAMANIRAPAWGYTLVVPVTEFTLRQDIEDTRLTVNKRNIWAVVPAGGNGRRLRVATYRSRGGICIPSDHNVEHEATLLGISRTHPTPVSAICIQPPDSGVGMRPC
jgi:hypothetical protein